MLSQKKSLVHLSISALCKDRTRGKPRSSFEQMLNFIQLFEIVKNHHNWWPYISWASIVLKRTLNNLPAKILKANGCNKNIKSKRLVNRNWNVFKLVKRKCIVQHSKEDANELITEMILNGSLGIGSQTYETNWMVSDCMYGVLMEMPWNEI